MGFFGPDYDREFRGYRSPDWSLHGADRERYRAPMNRSYGRDYFDRSARGYDGSARGRGGRTWGMGDGYGADFGYGPGSKSRWQTDHGDPFRDRQHGTPMRITGEGGGYDPPRGTRYGRDFRDHGPMGYLPYAEREGREAYDRHMRGRSAGRYDSDWFW